MRISFILLLLAFLIFAIANSLHSKQEKTSKDSTLAEKQLQKQSKEKPIDLSGTWIDRDDLNTEAWWFKFSIAGDDFLIMTFEPYSMPDHIFAWAKLTGRSFSGIMNPPPGPLGDSFFPLRIQGTINAEDDEVDMTVYYDKGSPGAYHLVRKK
jgi:hypothetical protein